MKISFIILSNVLCGIILAKCGVSVARSPSEYFLIAIPFALLSVIVANALFREKKS